jgi:hypothetical protein
MHSWRWCARGLVPAAMVMIGCGLGAMAEPGARSDQRLLFDPATFDQTPEIIDGGVPVQPTGRAPKTAHARKDAGSQRSPSGAAPRYFDRRLPTHGVDPHVSAVPKKSASDADGPGAARAQQSLSVGTFSLGVETDTEYKPRSPFDPDAGETGYDTNYDPRHRVSVPFIGLSAKSILPP